MMLKETINHILMAREPNEDALEVQRRNELSSYIGLTADIFDAVDNRIKPSSPMCVQIEVTNICGKAKCKLCHRWTVHDQNMSELSTNEINTLLIELAAFGTKSLIFSGGEPLTRHDFPEIVESAAREGFANGLITDGSNITAEVATSLAKSCRWITVSLDAPDADTYKRVRGWDGFEHVIQGLEELAVARTASNCLESVSISFTISAINISFVVDMIHWFQQHRDIADWLRFKFAHGQDAWQLSKLPAANTITELVTSLSNLIKDQPLISRGTNLPYLLGEVLADSSAIDIASGRPIKGVVYEPAERTRRCFTPYIFALVDPLGGVYPCCYLYFDNHPLNRHSEERARYCMGNVREESFRDIWHGEQYTRLRTVPDCNTHSICSECTRHYQHNRALNELVIVYKSLSEEDKLSYREISCNVSSHLLDQPIWF